MYSRIITIRMQIIVETLLGGGGQNGFRRGRSCIVAVGLFTIKQIIEKHREYNIEIDIAYGVDFTESFDRVKRRKSWTIPEKKSFPRHLLEVCTSTPL